MRTWGSAGEPDPRQRVRGCRWVALSFVVFSLVFKPPSARGDEGELAQRLEALERRLQSVEQENQQLKVHNRALQERLDRLEGRVAGATPSPTEPAAIDTKALDRLAEFAKRVDFYGDLRLRYEGIFQDDRADRHRERVRLRFGTNVKLNDYLTGGVRLVSGDPKDPTSTNQTLTGFFGGQSISFDRFFLAVKPIEQFSLVGGKFANPFLSSEMIWDEDVQPEGAAQTLALANLGPLKELKATAGQFMLEEVAAETDSYMFGGQLAGTFEPLAGLSVTMAGAYYGFQKPNRIAAALATGSLTSGNTNRIIGSGAQTQFLSDFELVDLYSRLTWTRWPIPLTAVVDYVHNAGAPDRDDGIWTEFYVGKLKQRGDWRVGYGYALVETDAVLSAFNSDDWLDTNIRTHMVDLAYQLFDNTTLKVEGFFIREHDTADPGIGDGTRSRIRLNMIVKF